MSDLISIAGSTLEQSSLSLEDYLLRESLENLIHPPDLETHPHWQTSIGKFFVGYKKKVVGQFIRKNLDKKFKDLEIARHWPKSVKEQINLDAALLSEIWRVVRLLPPPPVPRPIVFHYLVTESQLIFFQFSSNETEEQTVTNFVKYQQGINRSLESLDKNPFDAQSAPETWSFVDNCNRAAAQSDEFKTDYLELVRARMSFTRSLKESLPKRFDQSGQAREKRGRKSIPPSRKLSG